MMNQIKKVMDLVNELKKGKLTPQELAEKIKTSLPPQFLTVIKTETPESVIKKLEPMIAILGQDAVDLLKTESTNKLLKQALDILKD